MMPKYTQEPRPGSPPGLQKRRGKLGFRELPFPFRELPISFRELPIFSRELPIFSRELPISFRELPISFRELPISFWELPIFSRELPLLFQDLPEASTAVRTEASKDAPVINHLSPEGNFRSWEAISPSDGIGLQRLYNELTMDDYAPLNPCVEKTIALVFETFRGVTREGGVSWSESYEIDNYGTVDERQKARLRDKELGWEALTSDPEWIPVPGIGGFNFVDPIGFRYYLPAAMIKNLRRQEMGHWELDIVLESSGESDSFRLEMWSALQPAEIQCVCEFLKCMISVERAVTDPEPEWRIYSPNSWEEAYGSHWISLDANPVPIPPYF